MKLTIAALCLFLCRAAARRPFSLAFSRPARFPFVFRVCASVYCELSVSSACRGSCHRCRARTKVGDRPRERKTGKNQDFRPKSRKNATRIGQKHNKIKHVENIEKGNVSCETMQNSPKSGWGKRPAGRWFALKEGEALAAVKANVAARRSVWAYAGAALCPGKGVASKENI